MERVLINGREYTFIENFKDDAMLRKSYNELTQKTYGFDFEQWYKDGYWGGRYVPYSLMDGKRIVANVSVNIMDFLFHGQIRRFMQIGTVMTDKAYRNNGLSGYLMNRVISEWKNKCDMIYLFANDSVLNFYPKFGFTAANEYEYSLEVSVNKEDITAERLDMSKEYSRRLVGGKINGSAPVAEFTMLDNPGLIMFYLTSFMSSSVYYLKEQDVIAVASYEGDTLYLQDIFSSSGASLQGVIRALSNKKVRRAVLGFAPKESGCYNINLLKEEDTTLFVMMNGKDQLTKHKLRFPVLSHA